MASLSDLDIRLIIPALNEEGGIAGAVAGAPAFFREIIVVDNGSSDRTAERAEAAGARVVHEARKGYGRACKAGVAAAGACDILVFMDGDGADSPNQALLLVEPIAGGDTDLVIGSRRLGRAEPGALTPQQRFGNSLACWLMRVFWRGEFTDLGPFRAIRRDALESLAMDDDAFGWTVEMQVRSLQAGLRCVERPVDYRRRSGRSKISGTVKGVVLAGISIIFVILREKLLPYSSRPRKLPPVTAPARFDAA